MKRKVVKRMLPFLMALTLAGTTVLAEGDAPMQPPVEAGVTEEPGGETPEDSAASEEIPEGAEADGTEESSDDSETDGSAEKPDGSETDGSEETPEDSIGGDETEDPDGSVGGDETENPDDATDGDETENPDGSVDEDETDNPDESTGENGSDASEEAPDKDSDAEGDISFDEGGEETKAGAEGPEPSFEDEVVQAEQTYTSKEGFNFYISWSGSAVISGYTKSATSLVIPAKVTYGSKTYNVEGIGDSAFLDNTTITSVQIAEGPTYIGRSAFRNCTNLQSVSFPQTLTKIEESAFQSGSLKKLVLPEGLVEIGDYAFWLQSLHEGITFPSTLKQIGSYAFMSTKCPTLYLPSGLESIGYSSFSSNKELRTLTIPGSVKTIGDSAFSNCSNLNNVSLENGIQEIERSAFYGTTSLKTIYIPKSVVAIGSYVFRSSGLTTVYCEAGSAADNPGNYDSNVEIMYGNIKVAAPTFKEVAYTGGKDISFTSATKDAVIYYSTTSSNITTKDKWVANGGRATLGSFNGTVYARAYYGGQWSSVASHKVSTPRVATPTITVSGSKVTINSPTSGSTLYYTTDGSTPTVEKGIKANGTSVSLDSFAGLVKAIAVKNGCSNSAMAKKSLVNSAKNRNVSFDVKGVFGGRNVTFNSSVKGAKVYYSSTTSKLTTKDKCVNAGSTLLFENFYGTIYARTYYNGEWGNVCRLILKIPKVNAPSVEKLYTQRRVRKYNSYTGKYYYTTETVASGYAILATSTPSSIIYYTLDGSTPSPTNGRKLNASRGKVYVGTGHTIKAIAVRNCFTNSGVTTYR